MPITTDDHPPGQERATLANWRTAPFSRWAFHNVREIVPSTAIGNVPGDAWPLPATPISMAGFRFTLPNGVTLSLDAFLEATATDAIVVMLDGRIVFESYENGNTPHTPHILMSATKSVIGLVAGILHGRGILKIDAFVSDYVPEIAKTAYQGATIRNLLDMRTGIVFDDAQSSAYAAAVNWDPAMPDQGEANLAAFFEQLTASHKSHGGLFSYVSANTDLLGLAIERATGQTIATLLSTLLWQPMGAEDAAYITVDRKGLARSTGGLCATARDFARIGQLVLDDGRRGSSSIVPQTWIEDICCNGDRNAWTEGEWGKAFAPISTEISYRSGWYVVDEEPQILFAMGIHGQNLFVDRANRVVIAKFSSQDERLDSRAMWLTQKAVPEFRRCLLEA